MPSRLPRRTALRTTGVLAGAAVLGTAAAGTRETSRPAARRHELRLHDDARTGVLDPAEEPTVAASRALLARATAVVVSTSRPVDVRAGTEAAVAVGLPLLVEGPALAGELTRLGTRTVLAAGAVGPDVLEHREVVRVGERGADRPAGLPVTPPRTPVLLAPAPGVATPPALTALLGACRARTLALHHPDPRVTDADAAALRAAPDALVLGLGALGEHFAQRVRTVRHAVPLAGGGYLPFPGRRMVALYGHPGTRALGMLGEQSVAASVARVRALAHRYEPLVDVPVVPAFELIATVAAGSAGPDGTWSRRTPVRTLTPWVEAAEAAGIHVVLDLQPGRADFLGQAKAYESLLRRPHVGLALDPEWRLGPHERPLQRIGHVGIDEVNRVGRWLAGLVRDHDLPPKVLTLHQFSTAMVRDRQRLDTSLDEVQWLVHADGQGGQDAKQGTWDAVRADLPEGVWLGWKNFEDEDTPMLTPAQTVAQVHPTPSFVSYQ